MLVPCGRVSGARSTLAALGFGGVLDTRLDLLPFGGVVDIRLASLPFGGVSEARFDLLPFGGVFDMRLALLPLEGVPDARFDLLPFGGVFDIRLALLPFGGVVDIRLALLPFGNDDADDKLALLPCTLLASLCFRPSKINSFLDNGSDPGMLPLWLVPLDFVSRSSWSTRFLNSTEASVSIS